MWVSAVGTGAEIEVAPLPAGDYAVGAGTIVDRKRVLDLHAPSSRADSGRFYMLMKTMAAMNPQGQ